jgi:hypothetical protein
MNVHYYDVVRLTEEAETQLGPRFRDIQRVERGEPSHWLIPELQHCKLKIDHS